MVSRPRRAPRPYHHGDLPRALREGALELIVEVGAAGFTFSELARRVGVSHAAPYRHYADKAALLTALSAEGAHRLADAIEAALGERERDPRQRFLDAGYAYVRFAVDHPGYFQAMFSSDCDPEDPAALAGRERSLGLLFEYVADAQRVGFFGPGDPRELALPIFAMHQGLASLAAAGALAPLGVGDLRAASDLAHGRLLDGLIPAPQPPPAANEARGRARRR